MSGYRRAFEMFKTFLLFALFICSLFMIYKTWVYDDAILEDPSLKWLKTTAVLLKLYDEPEPSLPSIIDVELFEASRPVKAVVTTELGRHGSVYNFSDTDAIYDLTKNILGETLASSSVRRPSNELLWRTALMSPGVYFEFMGPVPLSSLCEWLGNIPPAHLEAKVKRLILKISPEDLTELYYIDETDGNFYSCTSNSRSIRAELFEFVPNDTKYVFETDTYNSSVNRYSISPEKALNPQTIASFIPENEEAQTGAVLRSFAFNPNTNFKHTEPDGTEVFVDAGRTLRISSGGMIVYRGGTETDEYISRLYVKKRGDTPTLTEMIEAARQVMSAALPSGSVSRCYLSSAAEEDGKTVIEFDYVTDGMRIFLDGGVPAGRVTIINGVITEARFHVRGYTKIGEYTGVLPQTQLLAILSGYENGNYYLSLGYFEEGDKLSAKWYAEN